MDLGQAVGENYANPNTCFFHVLFKAAALAFYILSSLFVDNFVIILWWNEKDDLGESVWKFECLDQQSLARMNKKDSWLFWWTLYLMAVAWTMLAVFSLIRLQADYLLLVGVCLTLSIANIVGFTKCQKDAKKRIQQFASRTIASRVSSTHYSQHSVLSEEYFTATSTGEENSANKIPIQKPPILNTKKVLRKILFYRIYGYGLCELPILVLLQRKTQSCNQLDDSAGSVYEANCIECEASTCKFLYLTV